MSLDVMPEWLINLNNEELNFIKKFVLSSGSLKEMAIQYGVTYPTVRQRLDNLSAKFPTTRRWQRIHTSIL